MTEERPALSAANPHVVEYSCPVCRSSKKKLLYDETHIPFTLVTPIPGLIAQCLECGLIYKIVGKEFDISSIYSDRYHESIDPAYFAGSKTHSFFRKVLKKIPLAPRENPPRLLDIGMGPGTLLEEASALGFNAQGIDLNEQNIAQARARHLNAERVSVEEMRVDQRFDVITMMDFLEHVREPQACLKKAFEALNPGGHLIVYTPNHAALIVRIAHGLYQLGFRRPIDEIFGDHHLSYFDKRSLTQALTRAGFLIDKWWLFPYDTARPGGPTSRFHLLAIGCIEWLGFPFGRVFRMVCFAHKPAGSP